MGVSCMLKFSALSELLIVAVKAMQREKIVITLLSAFFEFASVYLVKSIL
jgi:hypothetical protein